MNKIFERIYYRSPLFFQNFAISIFGLLWKIRRFGGIFKSEYKKAQKLEYINSEAWKKYETLELRKILLHANKTVPYYQKLFKEISLDENAIAHFELSQLSKIPILTKNDLRLYGENELLSTELEPKGEFLASSGSTGTPTRILFSHKMHQRYFGIFETCINNWAGLTRFNPRGMIGGRRIIKDGKASPPYYRYNIFEKQVYFSAYHISAKTVENYVEGMVKHKIDYLTGYASSNYFLARFIEEKGIKAPRLKGVLTSSEKCTQEMRDTFKRVYGCETFDSFNGVEACNLISECEHHKLHVVPMVGLIEVLNDKGENCLPGEIGEVISTGFLNFDQPLIRYRMGDLVKLSMDQTCPCGRSMTVIDEIIGRLEDTVIGSDGREMVRFHGIFINIPNLIESQVIQKEISKFEINIVSNGKLKPEDENLIKKRMKSQLGEVEVKINYLENIPKGANGKYKAVISEVKRA